MGLERHPEARPEVLPLTRHLIGDGRTKMDPWLHCGHLVDVFGSRAIYDLGPGSSVLMSNVIRDGNWSLPRASSSQLLNLFQIIRASHLPSVASPDEIVWMGSENGVFSMKEAMASYTSSPPPVWHDLIWFKGKVPQFSVLA